MTLPLVSTVVPVYNGERFLASALDSALAQNYPRHEVIVVDDGSTDATAEVARGYPDVRYMRQENGGPAAARNTGIEAAAGELICNLDADDVMVPGRIARQVGYLSGRPAIGCVLGRQELLVEPGIQPAAWARLPRFPIPGSGTDEPNENPYFPVGTMISRRSVFELVGLFDPSFRIGEDVDWMFRVREHGIGVGMLDEVVLLRRLHGTNLTQDAAAVTMALPRVFKARIDRRRRGVSPARLQ